MTSQEDGHYTTKRKPPPEDDEDDPPFAVYIALVAFVAICGTLVLAILWNRFCRRRRNYDKTLYRHRTQNINSQSLRNRQYPCVDPESMNFRFGPHNAGKQNPCYVEDETPIVTDLCGRREIYPVHHPPIQNREVSREDVEYERNQNFSTNDCNEGETCVLQPVPAVADDSGVLSPLLRQLMDPSERSSTKEVCGKQVVSVTRRVTAKGDYLPLDNMGIGLDVPPGAIKEGEEKMITLVLDWDLGDNPDMTEEQSLVSPVVYVGPHNLQLLKPCTLRYKHCAYDRRHIQVFQSETELTAQKQWQKMWDEENDNGTCLLTPDEVQLQINSFTLFTCVQSPRAGLKMGKWLQLAAFSYPLKSDIHHHQVRVYFLNKTPCALQWAIQNEAKFGGKLMCPEKAFLFYGNSEDIKIDLRYLSEKWVKVDDDYDRVQYLHIWHGQCPHVSMCFRKKESSHSNRELNFSLYVYQETIDNEGEKIVVHATEGNEAELNPCLGQRSCNKHTADNSTIIVTCTEANSKVKINRNRNESDCSVTVETRKTDCTCPLRSMVNIQSTLPHSVKVGLKRRLDLECPMGNNWKALAEKIGHSDCIDYIQTLKDSGQSPTELCLALAEQEGKGINDIKNILNEMRRYDAVKIIKDFQKTEETGAMAKRLSLSRSVEADQHSEQSFLKNERKILNVPEGRYIQETRDAYPNRLIPRICRNPTEGNDTIYCGRRSADLNDVLY